MTTNDITLTEQLINIPIQNSMCSHEIRRSDLNAALKHAKEISNRGMALVLRLRSLGAVDE